MKTLTPLLVVLLTVAAERAAAQPPSWAWARSGVGEEFDQANAVATDAVGNVFVAGYFNSDSITFGTLTVHNSTPGFADLYVVKYDATGAVQWARAAGGTFDDKAFALTTDADGNLYLAGNFYSPTITFGSQTFTNAGNVGDICVVKYDPAGTVLWATREGGPGLEIPYAIVVDGNDHVTVAGRFSSNSITFGTTTLLQAGSMDVFVVQYDAGGNVLWAQGAGGGTNDEAYALAVDAAGDIIVAGYFTQQATFGTFTLPNSGLGNIFLAKCEASTGTFQWAKATGSDGDERALAIDLDAQDNIYVAGFFQSDSLIFGGTTLYSVAFENGYVARYDNMGEPVWAHVLGGRSRARGLVVSNNAVQACGDFHDDTLHYGGDALIVDGGADLFVLQSDLAGNAQWAVKQSSGGLSGDIATCMATDPAGHLVIAGHFDSDDITFGATLLAISDSWDPFVVRMGDPGSGLADAPVGDPLLLYPDPATDHITVSGGGVQVGARWSAVNATGALVAQGVCAEAPLRIAVQNWPPGAYLLRFTAGQGAAMVRFVKQ